MNGQWVHRDRYAFFKMVPAIFSFLCLGLMFNSYVYGAPFNCPAGHWAEVTLVEAYLKGYLRGYPDGSLRPDDKVTRAEFAAIIVRTFDSDNNAKNLVRFPTEFPDVDQSHWSKGYLKICAEMNVIQGDDNGNIRPEDFITRQDAAVMIDRLLTALGQSLGEETVFNYKDDGNIAGYALESVSRLSSIGVIKGDDEGLFRPLDGLTRAEAMTIVVRVLDMLGKRWDLAGTIVNRPVGSRLTLDVDGQQLEISFTDLSNVWIYDTGAPILPQQLAPDDRVFIVLGSDLTDPGILVVLENRNRIVPSTV